MIITQIGDAELGERGYVSDGQLYRRMTEVLKLDPKPWLDRWKKKVTYEHEQGIAPESVQEILDRTSQIGDLIHKVLELNDLGLHREVWELVKLHEDVNLPAYLASWNSWKDRVVVEVVAVEVIVWSPKWGIAGRIDRIFRLKGDRALAIVDLKTGSLSPDIGKQLYGYKHMWNEMAKPYGLPGKVKRTLVAGLHRDGEAEMVIKEYPCDEWEAKVKEIVQDYNSLIQR